MYVPPEHGRHAHRSGLRPDLSHLVVEQLRRRVLLCARVCPAPEELHGVHRSKDHGSAQEHPGGESLTARMLLGGAMVLAAMYTVELFGRRADASAQENPPAELLHHEV